MNTRTFRTALIGLAVGVLLALLLAPQSRWMVRDQLALIGMTVGTPFAKVSGAGDRTQRAAAAHPNDLGMQMAALPNGNDSQYPASLRTLTPRFGNSPALYANLLRYETRYDGNMSGVHLDRPEENALETSPEVRARRFPAPPAPAVLAAFEADAAQGERLDPSNAYFPLMRSIGLFAAHRDKEGLAAVQRASTKPVWNEYISDETNGRLRLAEAGYGHVPSISKMAVVASVLYPEYAPLRAVARLVTVLAVHAELAGDKARGMRLRRALMTDGDLMRVQAQPYIGSLVGIAISAIARARPGGNAALKRPRQLGSEEWARARLDAFTQYARQAGFPVDAARAQAQFAAGNALRGLFPRAQDGTILSPQRTWLLAAGWIGSTLALVNAFWLLALAVTGALLSRLLLVRERLPLPAAARWGTAAAFALAVGAVALLLSAGDVRPLVALLLTLMAAGGGLGGIFAVRRRGEEGRREVKIFARALGVSALVLIGLTLVAAWQTRGILQFVQIGTGIVGLSGSDDGYHPNGYTSLPSQLVVGLMAAGTGLIVPLVLAIGLSIRARKRRVPAFAALAGGFREVALPLACLLVIGYGVGALGTLRQEQQMDDGLRQMIRHEGRYYARLTGEPWPGPA